MSIFATEQVNKDLIGSKKTNIENKKKLWNCIARDKHLYFMLVPFLLFYILFYYMPFYGLQIAFKDYQPFVGIKDSVWVGLDNFKTFFTGIYAMRLITNTIIINLYGLFFGFPAPIILALLLNEVRNKKYRTFVQTVSYMPYFISTVVVAGLVTNFLSPTSGIVNLVIERLGGDKIYFLSKPEYFRSIFTYMNIWQGTGFSSIIYISALCSIDAELYEAAKIDGAGRLKQLLHITIPGIMPTIAIMFILRVGQLLDVGFESIILLYQPATYQTADVISSFVYRSGLVESNYSMATAVGMFNGIVALFLVTAANKISKTIADISIW